MYAYPLLALVAIVLAVHLVRVAWPEPGGRWERVVRRARWFLGIAPMLAACAPIGGAGGTPGPAGAPGMPGATGAPGVAGAMGAPGAAGKDSTASGTRLVAQYLVTSDGARTFAGWYDSTLKVACAFGMASDGKSRCLPVVLPQYQFVVPAVGNGATIVYSDSACTVAGWIANINAQPPCSTVNNAVPFVQTLQTQSACPPPNQTIHQPPFQEATVWEMGNLMLFPAPVYYVDSAGHCVLTTTNPNIQDGYAASLVDPSTMVEGVVQ